MKQESNIIMFTMLNLEITEYEKQMVHVHKGSHSLTSASARAYAKTHACTCIHTLTHTHTHIYIGKKFTYFLWSISRSASSLLAREKTRS
jgi:hypothetical protein